MMRRQAKITTISGTVEGVAVKDLEMSEPLIIHAMEGSAAFSVGVQVEYEAEVTYDDVANGSYDSEEGDWAYLPTKNETVEEMDEFEVEIIIQYDPEDELDKPDAITVDCSIGQDFPVTVQPTDLELK